MCGSGAAAARMFPYLTAVRYCLGTIRMCAAG